MEKKRIISFEGIDGCGKTTQAKLLHGYLSRKGLETVILFEPGGTEVGESIRNLLLFGRERPCAWSELFLYLASRAQLLEDVIRGHVIKGRIVILDRYIDSTTAYQGYGRGLPVGLIRDIHASFLCGLFPDLTFLVDATARELAEVLEKKEKDRMERESMSFQNRVREGYLRIAEENDRVRIVARKSVQETHETIVKITEAYLNEEG